MPKVTGQKLRLLYVLKFLTERTDEEHGLTVGELTELLEACGISAERKTIYDDIEQLKLFGHDIQNLRGKDSGYRLLSRDFELSELVLLTDAVQSSRFITEKKSKGLIKKLASLTSTHQAKQLSRQVQVSGRIKSMEETIFYTVDTIHGAINADKQISFVYCDYDRRKQRIPRHNGKRYLVSPLSLCWDDEYYYLLAYDSDAEQIKHFRVDKMQSAAIDEAPRAKSEKELDVAAYTDRLFGMFGGNEAFVTLRCKDEKAGVIIDRFGKDVPFRLCDDGWFELTAKVILSPVFYGWVLGFGGDIVIKSPTEAVDELKKTAMSALKVYEEERT